MNFNISKMVAQWNATPGALVHPDLQTAVDKAAANFRAGIEFANIPQPDLVNQPPHYTRHPSGVECIQITEHMGFCLGNAVKYIWRADLKHDAIEDLKKARWYIDREIALRGKVK
jgi:Protein of unknwon function (DUF3310)